MTSKQVGTIQAIHLFPVKSMYRLTVDEAAASWSGLVGDRRFAFVRSGVRSNFPWLTGRQLPDLLRYRPQFENAAERLGRLQVKTPAGRITSVNDADLLAELQERAGEPIHLMELNRGTFDEMPISLVTTPSIHALSRLSDRPLDPTRFRINLIIDPAEYEPYVEESWLEQPLQIGESELMVTHRVRRCVMINLDPESGRSDPSVLKTVVSERDACLGVYGTVRHVGKIKVGDPVILNP